MVNPLTITLFKFQKELARNPIILTFFSLDNILTLKWNFSLLRILDSYISRNCGFFASFVQKMFTSYIGLNTIWQYFMLWCRSNSFGNNFIFNNGVKDFEKCQLEWKNGLLHDNLSLLSNRHTMNYLCWIVAALKSKLVLVVTLFTTFFL